MVTFFIELSSGNKKNIIIKLFEPSERRKYVFCGLKSADIVAGTISAHVFALVLDICRTSIRIGISFFKER